VWIPRADCNTIRVQIELSTPFREPKMKVEGQHCASDGKGGQVHEIGDC
jgi:hypothetical protein